MFQTIVVGVDGRPGGRDALAFAALLQRTFGAGVIAVVAYPHDELVSRAGSPAFEVAVRDEAVAALDAEIVRSGIDARAVAVADSSPPRALHRIAEVEGADLIVVGSDDQGPIGRVLAGDVTAGTRYASPCAVAVAPHGFATTEPVLGAIGVGYDESAESRRALELARAIAEATGATLELVAVVAPVVPVGPWMVAPVTTDDSQSAEHSRAKAMPDAAAPDPLVVRPSGPETLDRAEVVAIDAIGAIVGRAALSRLYGSRAALELELAPTTTVALALVDSMEREALARGLGRLELDASEASPGVVAALRRWRPVTDERRGHRLHLTWPTTPK